MFPIRPKGYSFIKSLSACHRHSQPEFLLKLWLTAKEQKLFHFSKEEDESRLKDNERLCLIHSYSTHNSLQPHTNG